MIPYLLNNQADIALGARFSHHYKGIFMHQLGNRVLTVLHNILFGCRLNDLYTCYKEVKREVFNGMALESNGFSIEQEIMAKAARKGLRVLEVPIEYYPRSYAQGKKIRYYDAFKIILRMLKLRLSR